MKSPYVLLHISCTRNALFLPTPGNAPVRITFATLTDSSAASSPCPVTSIGKGRGDCRPPSGNRTLASPCKIAPIEPCQGLQKESLHEDAGIVGPFAKRHRFVRQFGASSGNTSWAKIIPYGTKVPYRWLTRIDTLLLRMRHLVPFVDDHIDDRSPNTKDPYEGV